MEYHEDPHGLEQKPDVEEKETYSFMQETIKDQTGGRKKTRNLMMKYIGLGLVFGLAACLGFYALKPWAEEQFPGNPEKVTIPAEEEDKEEEEIDDTPKDEQVQEQAAPVLTIDNYREINRALYDVAYEVNKSIVEITRTSYDQGLVNESFDTINHVSGVIVFDNSQELLIFGKSSVTMEADSLTATFADGKSYTAEVKCKDENLGFAVFSVTKSEIQESTWSQIKIAVLGSSNAVGKGDAAIAVGSPFGYSGGMGYGIISSAKNVVGKPDGEFGLLTTDIAGTDTGSGVLANLHGEIVGIIDQSVSGGDSMKLTTAYGISDLKEIIELLSNGETVPYIGIKGVTISDELAREQGIPQGVYVQEVRVDSPAMIAGIQSGDVIVSVDREEVGSLAGYHKLLMAQKTGDEVKITGKRQGSGGYVDIDFTVMIGSKE